MTPPTDRPGGAAVPGSGRGSASTGVAFRVRLTGALIAAAVVPVAAFGGVILVAELDTDDRIVLPLLLVSVVAGALLGLLVAYFVGSAVTTPLRTIAIAVRRVAAGEPGPAIRITGDDELADLAESHNRIAADTNRRNAQLTALLEAVAEYAPGDGVDALVARAARDAARIFGLIECRLRTVDPQSVPPEERVPGEPRPVRAEVRAGTERIGVLAGHLPATASWELADQHLLELFAIEVGVALRNAELFGRIESQNVQLRELDAAKDEFLRGVSHNLQTPLTSIRAYVDQLRSTSDGASSDRRLTIVAEQTDRLSRLVRQLLTVTRIEAGVLRSEPAVLALAPRVRRAWDALGASDVPFELRDDARGWLAVADPDQLDQVLWALLDNAVKYGGGTPVSVSVAIDEATDRLRVTIADRGPGVADADRSRLFERFARGSGQTSGDGTGLGLYLSRELARSMGGELRLEPAEERAGAAFALSLPGEPPED